MDPLFTKICMEKPFLYNFRCHWPWTAQICSPSYSCPGSSLHQIWSFHGFLISNKSYAVSTTHLAHIAGMTLRPTTKCRTTTGLFDVTFIVHKQRLGLFGHVVRLPYIVPVNQSSESATNEGRPAAVTGVETCLWLTSSDDLDPPDLPRHDWGTAAGGEQNVLANDRNLPELHLVNFSHCPVVPQEDILWNYIARFQN